MLLLGFITGALAVPAFQNYRDNYADSLEVKLILMNAKDRVHVFNTLAEHYLRNEPLKAMKNAREAYSLAQTYKNPEEEARALRNVGRSFQHLVANYDSALYYCFESLKTGEVGNFKQEVVKTNMAIANIYSEVGNYSKSIDFLTQGEIIATELRLYEKIIEIKILRAGNLINLDLTGEALEELRSALKTSKLHDLVRAEGNIRLALGDYYLIYSSPELSQENIRIAREIFQRHGREEDNARALFYMARWHMEFGKEADAISHFEQSLDVRKKLGDLYGIAECYLYIGLCQNKLSDYDAAIKTLETCRNLAEQLDSKRLLRRCYNQLFLAYSSKGNLKKAIEYRDLYVAIIELIFAEENERQIAEQQAKFDIEKKDQELELQGKRLELETLRADREQKFNVALTLLVVIFMSSGVFIFILLRKNQASNEKVKEINRRVIVQNQQLKKLNDTKNKFFSIIGHDIKGPLASLTAFLNLLKNHLSNMSQEEIVTVATELDGATKNLQLLLENLLTWARSQTDNIDIKPENIDLKALVKENFALLGNQAAEKNIELSLVSPNAAMCKADKNTINTAIRNLISNAIKFTYEHGKIEVRIEEWKDVVELSVKDNGMGMSAETLSKIFEIGSKYTTPGTKKEKGTGLGLILCKEFIEKNSGKLRVKSEAGMGSTFSFTLPRR